AARVHGTPQQIFVDMLGANAYANNDVFIQYDGQSPPPTSDPQLHGPSATYRLYRALTGWVFLAVPTDREFSAFCASSGLAQLPSDPSFSSVASRKLNNA